VSLVSRLDRPLAWLADRRLRQLESLWRDPLAVQERTLRAMTRRARDTAWGREHGFAGIRGIADYQRRAPVMSYLDLRPFVERAIGGERDVLWPGRPAQYSKTSGTTAGEKYIPVTREAFQGHRRGGLDTLLVAVRRVGDIARLDGSMLFLGGSTRTEPIGPHAEVGDLSGLAVRWLPAWIRGRYTPGAAIAAVPDWERRIAATAELARRQDVRLISGMPAGTGSGSGSSSTALPRGRSRAAGSSWPRGEGPWPTGSSSAPRCRRPVATWSWPCPSP
jgi:hypothetical protein